MIQEIAMLCVVGDLVEDVVVRMTGAPARGTDTPAVVERSRGGSAANVAAAAALTGCPTRFIGRVGDDTLGGQLAAALAHAGVDVRLQRAGRTGTVVVLVEPGGERTMLPDRGAAQQLGPVAAGWLAGVGWLHAPAYSLCAEPIGTSTLDVVGRVRGAGGRWSVDVSSVAVVRRFGPERFAALLAVPDVVFATATEARLAPELGVPLLVVKDGAKPVVLHWADGRRAEVPVAPVAGVTDTTGAGDAFAGGFLAATLRGASPVEAAAAGSALAARTLRLPGARLAP